MAAFTSYTTSTIDWLLYPSATTSTAQYIISYQRETYQAPESKKDKELRKAIEKKKRALKRTQTAILLKRK